MRENKSKEIYLGKFLVENKQDEELLEKYLTERILYDNELYLPKGLKRQR